ncbi:FRG domain protein [Sedimentisphaera cyanobacteriorum]|uniref:FRG domain protein n=1 Tax=Sedimentisphaera cyanobacteriorum TaxID=1940790 RepID=A0A1Q2HLG4_9BACT|nr:FRG domain-containing protein [Sedimentisphaera cyanobacteriorum]AQQ08308.1 FRG domain protein [Sedimentisphaera cyanobacteriorum]
MKIKEIIELTVKKIDDLEEFSREQYKYIFRGQSNNTWGLNTTFERVVKELPKDRLTYQEDLVRFEFKRQAHHYINHTPKSELEWLALMQHYGCPTRLLDFTRSFWVGLFFALDESVQDAALWVIDISSEEKEKTNDEAWKFNITSKYNEKAEAEVEQILAMSKNPEQISKINQGIIIAEPKYMNDRLRIQQGVFTFPKDITSSYYDNLISSGRAVKKITIPKKFHGDLLRKLYRMNITSSTLYPGLEGYARSMKNHILIDKEYQKQVNKDLDTIFKNFD